MPTNTTPTSRYLKPWSVIEDEELRMLREIRGLVECLSTKEDGYVLYMQGGTVLEIGKIAQIVRKMKEMGK